MDGQRVKFVRFSNEFDQGRGAGATIRRMLDSLFSELAQSDSLLTNEVAIQSYEEYPALSLLLGLRHNHSERLLRQQAAAAPANVGRAEEFMRANARGPVTIEAVANAAGCSIRALQLAFRRFRGTTPMAALQRVRLEAARADILRIERDQSLTRIAAEYGFSNGALPAIHQPSILELPTGLRVLLSRCLAAAENDECAKQRKGR